LTRSEYRPDGNAELEAVRRAYAKHLLAAAGIADKRIEAAFATVPREAFLGPGPWAILRWATGYVPTPSPDPVYLYTDVPVGIIPERGLNNGAPSFHIPLLASAAPAISDHVVHVGAGTGYYTAILAHLVGREGRVTAIEFDRQLAARAAANLASLPQVRVIQGNGVSMAFDPADVIYVNAGVTRPAAAWLDQLSDAGRLILPLTARKAIDVAMVRAADIERYGGVFRVERRRAEYFARWISAVGVFPCEGGRDARSEASLAAAFEHGGWRDVTRLYRTDDLPDHRCWVRAPGWSLAYD
jgi:protein-L-isoaspartate(D-aspartate) O-methyltransferase